MCYKNLQVVDEQLRNSLTHRCFYVVENPVVKFMDVLQVRNSLPFQLCILKLQKIVEGSYAKCAQNKNRIACITQSPYFNHNSSSRVRSFICQYWNPRFLSNIMATGKLHGVQIGTFSFTYFLPYPPYLSGLVPEYLNMQIPLIISSFMLWQFIKT